MKTQDWVCCPVCGEPDMLRTFTKDEDEPLIECVNHACKSNGGGYEKSPALEKIKAALGPYLKPPDDAVGAIADLRQIATMIDFAADEANYERRKKGTIARLAGSHIRWLRRKRRDERAALAALVAAADDDARAEAVAQAVAVLAAPEAAPLHRMGWRIDEVSPGSQCVGDHRDAVPAVRTLWIGRDSYPLCVDCRFSLAHLLS